MGQTVADWARMYVDDIVRATYPPTRIDADSVLKQYEKKHGTEALGTECSTLDQDALTRIGHELHVLTVGALHSKHATKHGGPHPGLKHVQV